MKTLPTIAALLLAVAGIGNACADHVHGGHVHFGVMVGPYWGPFGYPPGYYYPPYYPPTVIVRPAPQVYIEQPVQPAEPAAPANDWYYCAGSRAYYPYVRECPGGWQRVAPLPPSPAAAPEATPPTAK